MIGPEMAKLEYDIYQEWADTSAAMWADRASARTEPLIALIPARSGSKRILGKNIKSFGGHPLMAHTIAAARRSGLFQRIVVSSDSDEYLRIAEEYGADTHKRLVQHAGDRSPDIDWVFHVARQEWEESSFDAFAILRPTAPFRSAASIRRAWDILRTGQADSVRAVRPVAEHPAKMWVIQDDYLLPLLPYKQGEAPWHSNQKSVLPIVYVQTAGLEFAWSNTLWRHHSISGSRVLPIILQPPEDLDLNTQQDWAYAELLLRAGHVLEDPKP